MPRPIIIDEKLDQSNIDEFIAKLIEDLRELTEEPPKSACDEAKNLR